MTNTPRLIGQPQKRPLAILFDYDGVLVASEPIHLSAWMQLLDELGLPQDQKTVTAGIGKTAPEILKGLLDQYRPGWSPTDYPVHDLAIRKNDFYLQEAQSRLKTYPGVPEGLEWLKENGIPCSVVSNGRRREVERTLKKLGLFSYFNEIVTRDDVPAFKPDPTPYLFAAASLGINPQNCLAVEDSPTGLEAALFAKVPVAGITSNFPTEILERPVPGRNDLSPVWIGPSFKQFMDWVKKLP